MRIPNAQFCPCTLTGSLLLCNQEPVSASMTSACHRQRPLVGRLIALVATPPASIHWKETAVQNIFVNEIEAAFRRSAWERAVVATRVEQTRPENGQTCWAHLPHLLLTHLRSLSASRPAMLVALDRRSAGRGPAQTLNLPIRIVLVVLIGLLALPIMETTSPVAAKSRLRTVTRSFANTRPIVIPDNGVAGRVQASPYPGAINFGGFKRGKIRDVNVRLKGFEHDNPDDVEVLLVGPGGQAAVLIADVGGFENIQDVTWRLDDEATEELPDASVLISGIFRPTKRAGAVSFMEPAPDVDPDADLSVFDGTNPNGTWRLFVHDINGAADPGAFKGGWALEIKAQARIRR